MNTRTENAINSLAPSTKAILDSIPLHTPISTLEIELLNNVQKGSISGTLTNLRKKGLIKSVRLKGSKMFAHQRMAEVLNKSERQGTLIKRRKPRTVKSKAQAKANGKGGEKAGNGGIRDGLEEMLKSNMKASAESISTNTPSVEIRNRLDMIEVLKKEIQELACQL